MLQYMCTKFLCTVVSRLGTVREKESGWQEQEGRRDDNEGSEYGESKWYP